METVIRFRCSHEDAARYRRKAAGEGEKLSAWLRRIADAAVEAGVAQTPASPSGPERKSDRLLTGGTRSGTPPPASTADGGVGKPAVTGSGTEPDAEGEAILQPADPVPVRPLEVDESDFAGCSHPGYVGKAYCPLCGTKFPT